MTYVEIYIVGWILWTVIGSLMDGADVRLVMLLGLFWFIIVPIVAVAFPASLLTDYVRSVKRARAARKVGKVLR